MSADAPVTPASKKPIDINSFKLDPKKATPADIQAALDLLAKARYTNERIKAGEIKGSTSKKVSEMTEEEKKKYTAYNQRLTAKNAIIMAKAKKADITVTEAEIDTYLKAKAVKA